MLSRSGMQELLETIREECSSAAWSKGVTLARSGSLTGKQTAEGEIEVRIATAGGMTSPLVVLSPEHGDWSCECPSREDVCPHVAGAIITLARAEKDGQELLGVKGPGASVVYALSTVDGALSLQRMLRKGEELSPFTGRLTAAKQTAALADVATTRADLEIDILLGTQAEGVIASPLLPKLLEQLAGDCEVSLDGQPIHVGEPTPLLRAQVEDTKDGFRIRGVRCGGDTPPFANGAVLHDGKLCPVANPGLSGADLEQLKKGRQFGFGDVADLVGRILPNLEERLPIDVKSKLLPTAVAMPPRIALNSEAVDGKVRVLPTLVYGDPPCARVDAGRMTYLGGALPLRDPRAEQRLCDALRQKADLDLGRAKVLEADEAVRLGEQLAQLGDVHFSGKGANSLRVHGRLQASLTIDGASFDLSFESSEGQGADAEAVLRAWQQQSPLVALSGGGFAQLPTDWLSKYGHMVLDLLAARDADDGANGAGGTDGALSGPAQLDLVRLCEALDHPPPPELAGVRALLEDAASDASEPQELVDGITATLRDYQREGVDWLSRLSRAGMGALLADDMGLGKTLQALCALNAPALVVCPASLLFNWNAELAKFRPGLSVATYHGPKRALDPDADVTLTTYAIMRLDREALSEREWDTLVLDEAHTIKNPESQVSQAAYQLPARFRIALTGTPVENRLEDLWSQMHFLNRGLLGGRRDFAERYATPIADGDTRAGERLRQRVQPLLLRRLKRDVAKELPPRTDLVDHCKLDEREQAIYDAVRAAAQKDVVEQLDQGGGVMAALEALLRLRQACCHPGLLPGREDQDSSKLRLLRSMLEEVLSEGHKALVFSQWTSFLDLLEPGLDAAGHRYVRLDGSTQDRQAVVDQFQTEPDTRLMLLSLKAGGVGLNLTAADHVFMLDPWWNPAVEDQAADRAHRIGQDRPVFVHRLVAEGSVEERILDLQQRKRALADAATGGAQAGQASLSRADLLALLS